MFARSASVVAPLYLLACLLLGGSVQGIWSNLALQLAAIVILAWALMAGRSSTGRGVGRLRWIAIAGLTLVALQMIPVPPAFWTELRGRSVIVDGFTLLEQPLPWMPASVAPEQTLSALLSLLPAAAMMALLLRAPVEKSWRIAAAVIFATFVSVLVAVMQITRGAAWYPYSITSQGSAVGLFANSNHFAALMLVTVPLIVALAASLSRHSEKNPQKRIPSLIAIAVGAIIVLIGMILNQSFAIFLLGGPIIAGSALIFLPRKSIRIGRLAVLITITLAAGAAVLFAIGTDRLTRLAGQASISERQQIWETSSRLASDYFPVGSGLGSFESVYHLQENPELVAREYVNHAHNDFLELIIELGLPGAVLILLFLVWWILRFAAIWRSGHSPPIARAATLVSLSLILHSLVDFPLRPAALSALFATAIALMALPVRVTVPEGRSPPRHLKLEDLE